MDAHGYSDDTGMVDTLPTLAPLFAHCADCGVEVADGVRVCATCEIDRIMDGATPWMDSDDWMERGEDR